LVHLTEIERKRRAREIERQRGDLTNVIWFTFIHKNIEKIGEARERERKTERGRIFHTFI
jgi:uncharacterized LabA/DUF88 family protein